MKTCSTLILVFLSSISIAQNISGRAFYESKTTVKTSEIGRKDMDENMREMIAERMENYLEKTFVLTFNGVKSLYKEEKKLESEKSRDRIDLMLGSFSPGVQYKNIETLQFIEEREFYGKQFLIKDTISNLEWTLEKESKKIGQYVVFKATAMKILEENNLGLAKRNEVLEKQSENDKEVVVPKEIIVTAWYTPQIPVKTGPGRFSGLPGLILELNFYRTTILCSKIVINPNELAVIKVPKKGKEVTRKEYNTIVKKKVEEMRENFRGRDRKGGAHFRGGN